MFSVNVMRQQDAVSEAIVNKKLDLLYLFSITWEIHHSTPLSVTSGMCTYLVQPLKITYPTV